MMDISGWRARLELSSLRVRSSGFQFTFDQCYVTEALNDFIMRYSVLSLLTTWKDIHDLAVF